jgi:hypothetical protein
MLSRIRAIVGVCALVGVSAFAGAVLAPPATAGPSGLALSGNRFLLNGQPFVPHGFNSIALPTRSAFR